MCNVFLKRVCNGLGGWYEAQCIRKNARKASSDKSDQTADSEERVDDASVRADSCVYDAHRRYRR